MAPRDVAVLFFPRGTARRGGAFFFRVAPRGVRGGAFFFRVAPREGAGAAWRSRCSHGAACAAASCARHARRYAARVCVLCNASCEEKKCSGPLSGSQAVPIARAQGADKGCCGTACPHITITVALHASDCVSISSAALKGTTSGWSTTPGLVPLADAVDVATASSQFLQLRSDKLQTTAPVADLYTVNATTVRLEQSFNLADVKPGARRGCAITRPSHWALVTRDS